MNLCVVLPFMLLVVAGCGFGGPQPDPLPVDELAEAEARELVGLHEAIGIIEFSVIRSGSVDYEPTRLTSQAPGECQAWLEQLNWASIRVESSFGVGYATDGATFLVVTTDLLDGADGSTYFGSLLALEPEAEPPALLSPLGVFAYSPVAPSQTGLTTAQLSDLRAALSSSASPEMMSGAEWGGLIIRSAECPSPRP